MPANTKPTTWPKRVLVRELLFTFTSLRDWVEHAQGLFRAHGHTSESAICVDLAGMICTRGKHFAEARYPVSVYAIDDPPYEPCGMNDTRIPK